MAVVYLTLFTTRIEKNNDTVNKQRRKTAGLNVTKSTLYVAGVQYQTNL